MQQNSDIYIFMEYTLECYPGFRVTQIYHMAGNDSNQYE